jgi:hypothetical protein
MLPFSWKRSIRLKSKLQNIFKWRRIKETLTHHGQWIIEIWLNKRANTGRNKGRKEKKFRKAINWNGCWSIGYQKII